MSFANPHYLQLEEFINDNEEHLEEIHKNEPKFDKSKILFIEEIFAPITQKCSLCFAPDKLLRRGFIEYKQKIKLLDKTEYRLEKDIEKHKMEMGVADMFLKCDSLSYNSLQQEMLRRHSVKCKHECPALTLCSSEYLFEGTKCILPLQYTNYQLTEACKHLVYRCIRLAESFLALTTHNCLNPLTSFQLGLLQSSFIAPSLIEKNVLFKLIRLIYSSEEVHLLPEEIAVFYSSLLTSLKKLTFYQEMKKHFKDKSKHRKSLLSESKLTSVESVFDEAKANNEVKILSTEVENEFFKLYLEHNSFSKIKDYVLNNNNGSLELKKFVRTNRPRLLLILTELIKETIEDIQKQIEIFINQKKDIEELLPFDFDMLKNILKCSIGYKAKQSLLLYRINVEKRHELLENTIKHCNEYITKRKEYRKKEAFKSIGL